MMKVDPLSLAEEYLSSANQILMDRLSSSVTPAHCVAM